MQTSNKFLLIIVISIVLLIIAAFLAVTLQPDPTYQDDITPDGTAHNYLLAIQQKNYERAYSYIPTDYPYPKNADDMRDDITDNNWLFDIGDDFSLVVESAEIHGDGEATVIVRKTTFHNNGLMGSNQSTRTFTLTLIQENGSWKVSDGKSYWSNCWGYSQRNSCR